MIETAMRNFKSSGKFLPAVALMVTGWAGAASAHPHVWVDVKATVAYEDGKIAGFQYAWTFDEAYSTMAVEGLDTNGDGKYDRKELAELAQVNIDGLKEFEYFTHAKLGDAPLKVAAPKDYWLERNGTILTLHFTLPLADPVLASAKGFNFQVYDPTFFISFELAKENPVALSANAPSGCKADVSVPADETEEAQKLGDSFFQQFGGDIGIGMAQTVSVVCPST